MSDAIQARIFLVGCPRSGTTLLQSMLAAHSQITSFPESHFLLITSRTRRGRWMRKLGLVSPEMRLQLRQFLAEIGRPALMPRRILRLQPFIAAFRHILDQVTLAQGKSIWLEKTPGHLYYINDFTKAIPDARFIHLVRNGADVVASLYAVTHEHPTAWGGRYSIEQCIQVWNRSLALTRAYAGAANHTIVRYEPLVADPLLTLATLTQFIGAGFEPTMITGYQAAAPGLIAVGESWKTGAMHELTAHQSQKFNQIFTPQEQRNILERLQAGYV